MAYATLQGSGTAIAVVSCKLRVPRTGVWHADLDIDTDNTTGLLGPLVLSLGEGASLWTGTFFRGDESFGRVGLRMLGGASGLANVLPGQSYSAVTAKVPLLDALNGAGEHLSTGSNPSLLAFALPAWSRLSGTASLQLDRLASTTGATWRLLSDGTVWWGIETYPAAATFQYDLLDKGPRHGRWTLGSTEGYKLLPGTSWQGGTIAAVEHDITANAIRTHVWFE